MGLLAGKKKWVSVQNGVLVAFIFLGIFLRLQNFHLLPIDGHAMRQTDTESVAYNFAFNDHNILYPQNSLIRPQSNTNAYFFLEFPAYQWLISVFYRLFGWHIEVAHLVNIGLYMISVGALFYFVRNYFKSYRAAFFSALFFTFAPGSIFFVGHAIHPDVFAVTTILLSLALYVKSKKTKNVFFIFLSLFLLSLSVATRPFILIILPAYLYLLWTLKASFWEYPAVVFFSPLIYGLWKLWQKPFIAADHSWENWIFAGREHLLTWEVGVRQLLFKNVIGEVMGKAISFIAFLGLLATFIKGKKEVFFPLFWLIGVPIYYYVVPYGNIVHQYYADVYLVPVILLAGYGAERIFTFISRKSFLLAYCVSLVVILGVCYNGYRTSRYYFEDLIPPNQVKIAREIDKALPPDAKIVYLGLINPIPFSLYHRKGWVVGASPVDVDNAAGPILGLKQYGAEYVVEGLSNNDLATSDLEVIKQNTDLFYSSKWIRIYKIR